MPKTIRERIASARENLQYTVDNALADLGRAGQKAGELILTDVQDEFDDIEALLGDDDDA